ncbi:MAG TPA: hypothetical protein PKI93_00480 [Alphaproteobacteria bacterium]|nr:hypothetical protein [Alphaproteobacteria bacterium]HNS44706.1 hypothetical protein [Alphaproteobacteria bacterium]
MSKDLPKTRIEAMERAELCGMSAKDGSRLYMDKGQDRYNQYTAKQEQCYAEGPKKGFLEEAAGWLSEIIVSQVPYQKTLKTLKCLQMQGRQLVF